MAWNVGDHSSAPVGPDVNKHDLLQLSLSLSTERRQDLLRFIEIQWEDIHHSRNQDWKALLVIVSVFAALFVVNKDFKGCNTFWIQIFISVGGVFACVVGALMAWAHWRIFYSKLRVIAACEHLVGISAHILKNRFAVQGLIFLIYFLLAAPLVGWMTWLLAREVGWRYPLPLSFAMATLTGTLGLWECWRQHSKIKERIDKLLKERDAVELAEFIFPKQ